MLKQLQVRRSTTANLIDPSTLSCDTTSQVYHPNHHQLHQYPTNANQTGVSPTSSCFASFFISFNNILRV